jgi:O-acetylhomoserine/O-acetylserine sulfhydrylase-like pyridoxal-dependent enzyme
VLDKPGVTIFPPEYFYPATDEQREGAYGFHHASRLWHDAQGLRIIMLRAEKRLAKATQLLEKERRLRERDQSRHEREILKLQDEKRVLEERLAAAASGESGPKGLTMLFFLRSIHFGRIFEPLLRALIERGHAVGATVVVDNTFATPLGQRPLELGADFSMASASKQLTGHADLILGYVAARDPDDAARLVDWRILAGSVPGPFEVWLAHRSLATLGVRLDRACSSAQTLAERLAGRDDLASVRYPGLPSDPSHELALSQMSRYGTIVCFTVESAGRADRFLDECRLVKAATSFGGVHSSAERRARWGGDDVAEGFIRFSVGCEDPLDIVADVEQALDASGSR